MTPPPPPIWNRVGVLRSGRKVAMPWQPMPPKAIDPSGTLVELLCGQPAQNEGWRTSAGVAAVTGPGAATPSRASSRAMTGIRRAAVSSPSAGTSGAPPASRLPSNSGRSGRFTSRLASCSSMTGRFSSTTRTCAWPAMNAVMPSGSSGQGIATL